MPGPPPVIIAKPARRDAAPWRPPRRTSGRRPEGPRRPEYGDRRPDVREGIEASDEFALDAEHPPRVGLEERRAARCEPARSFSSSVLRTPSSPPRWRSVPGPHRPPGPAGPCAATRSGRGRDHRQWAARRPGRRRRRCGRHRCSSREHAIRQVVAADTASHNARKSLVSHRGQPARVTLPARPAPSTPAASAELRPWLHRSVEPGITGAQTPSHYPRCHCDPSRLGACRRGARARRSRRRAPRPRRRRPPPSSAQPQPRPPPRKCLPRRRRRPRRRPCTRHACRDGDRPTSGCAPRRESRTTRSAHAPLAPPTARRSLSPQVPSLRTTTPGTASHPLGFEPRTTVSTRAGSRSRTMTARPGSHLPTHPTPGFHARLGQGRSRSTRR